MAVREGFVGSIGNTPLIRLATLSKETGCDILGKAGFPHSLRALVPGGRYLLVGFSGGLLAIACTNAVARLD